MERSKPKPMSGFGSIVILIVLLVYAASALRLDSIHQFFHAENIAELHSAEKESDPCHKNIYHQQKKSGCEHKSHITENSKCAFCEYCGGSKEILSDRLETTVYLELFISETFYQGKILSFLPSRYTGRGPPEA